MLVSSSIEESLKKATKKLGKCKRKEVYLHPQNGWVSNEVLVAKVLWLMRFKLFLEFEKTLKK